MAAKNVQYDIPVKKILHGKNMSISWEMDMCISLCNLLVQIEMGAGSTP